MWGMRAAKTIHEMKRVARVSRREDKTMMETMGRMIQHPKTSVAGVLLALTTVAGVLQQQGVSLGHVGTGTAVSLASALATAFLGLLAKD
jgi:hypothetical protein